MRGHVQLRTTFPTALWQRSRVVGCCVAAIAVGAAVGCFEEPSTALARLTEARRLSASLQLGLTKAADAANRAVMADTDEASVTFAREAEQATQAVERDARGLQPILRGLKYGDESALLADFDAAFAKYRALDETVLGLAVENTNLKAQQLSFGPARAAADALRDALDPLTQSGPPSDVCKVRALAATVVASVREIQALQAPHIAEAEDAAMTRIEQQMTSAETQARSALRDLLVAVEPSARSRVDAATAALDRFMGVNAQILVLSRRNTNVRSLALSLGEKRAMTAVCEERLHALQDALAKRGFLGTR